MEKKLEIKITGNEDCDLESALEQVLESIRSGNTTGFDRNETGSYHFSID